MFFSLLRIKQISSFSILVYGLNFVRKFGVLSLNCFCVIFGVNIDVLDVFRFLSLLQNFLLLHCLLSFKNVNTHSSTIKFVKGCVNLRIEWILLSANENRNYESNEASDWV